MYKKVVVVGLGESGYASACYFAERHIPVAVVDSRKEPPKLAALRATYPKIPVYTGGFPHAILSDAETVVVSPGIAVHHPDIVAALSCHTEVVGDIEIFARDVQAPVVAITGSNGKSTVTTLVGEMAKAAGVSVGVGGNLGPPALSLLNAKSALYVLELSSFQLETTCSLKPKGAVLLNLSADHMDRYASLEAYGAAKQRVFQHCSVAVVNRQDVLAQQYGPHATVPTVSFGLDAPPTSADYGIVLRGSEQWLARGKVPLMAISELRLLGLHNVANVLAALALGDVVQLPWDAMEMAIRQFTGLPHRCEQVRTHRGVVWINDSKGTNVGATVSALQGLAGSIPGKWILIAGGLGKNADFRPLKPLIQTQCRMVILIGEAAEQLSLLLQDGVLCRCVATLPEAVFVAAEHAGAGEGVLLSPACASLDMFENFEHRGNVFREAVQGLV